MKYFGILGIFAMISSVFAGCASADRVPAGTAAKKGELAAAWVHWRNGDIELAEAAALAASPSSGRDHLLFKCAFAKGEYEGAIRVFSGIDRKYAEREGLCETVIEAYVHLGRFSEAAAFARAARAPKWQRAALDAAAASPLRVELRGTTAVPFVEVPLMGVDFSDSLPGVEAEICGLKAVAHFDSGASYLVMSPAMAKSLGIELVKGEMGFAALSWGRLSYGIAKSLRIGDALIENVPVTAAPQLSGATDRILFGTAILESFLSTVDFRSRRLLLSPRGDPVAKEGHLGLLEGMRTEVPFYLWGDHYMFARGSIGGDSALNFFIDSGLFFVIADEDGEPRRGSMLAAKPNCVRWGMNEDETKKGYFECRAPISLGALLQESSYIAIGPIGTIEKELGGVRIDALLSNGFLGRYAWTIDFDRRVYIFSGTD